MLIWNNSFSKKQNQKPPEIKNHLYELQGGSWNQLKKE